MAPPEPRLDEAAAALVAAGARFVVIGGFALIANRLVRATEDVDFLVPDDPDNDRRVLAALRELDGVRMRDASPLLDEHLVGQTHLRALTRAGIIDVMRGGMPPLDFDTVASEAMVAAYDGLDVPVAGLRALSASSASPGVLVTATIYSASRKFMANCPMIRFRASKTENEGRGALLDDLPSGRSNGSQVDARTWWAISMSSRAVTTTVPAAAPTAEMTASPSAARFAA